VKFKFSLSVNSATSHCCCVAALFAVSAVIIDDITLLINYNYSSAKNVLSTINKLKMTAEILCC